MAARSLYQRRHKDIKLENLVIYTTTQTHSLGAKAGLILGTKVKAIEVQLEDQLSLRGKTLKRTLEEDVDAGLHPFILSTLSPFRRGFVFIRFLVATIGTTSSGAVDNISEIAEVGK